MKNLSALVVSSNNLKTVVAKVVHQTQHPKYKKIVTSSTRIHAHCDQQVSVGDTVLLESSRPFSKMKRFVVSKIIKKV